MNFELKIALRYLKSRRGFISFIAMFSLLGIALGVATLIVVMAVMGGFHSEIASKMIGWGGDINVSSYNETIENYDQIIDKIKQIKEVKLAYPIVNGQVMIKSKYTSGGAIIKAMKKEDVLVKSIIKENIISGDLSDFDDDNILIGSDLAASSNLKIGDEVTLISPKGTNSVIGFIPRMKNFHIVGIFKSGMYQYDSTSIIMPLTIAQLYFKTNNAVNNIEIEITDRYQSDKVANLISKTVGLSYLIEDWQLTNATYFNVLKTERVVMFLILTLIIIVAAFNIVSSLTMLVRDKSKDIAILRTIGATRYSIMKIFMICGSILGLAGTSLGVILGLSFALNIEKIRKFLENISGTTIFDPVVYYLSSLPAEVKLIEVLSVVIMSITLSLCATFYPAYSAAKINPADGLRYE